ncbi:MAG: hypothetical protein AB7G13_25625 [Lautropia sp.]
MRYLKRFAVTGSVCPSTRIFGERAAAETAALAPTYDRVVVAGIGSGVVASRILERLPDAIFVECDTVFAGRFATCHPTATVVTGRIEQLFEFFPALRGKRLLLASFVPTAGNFYSDEIVRFFVAICRAGGQIMQMRYLPHQMSARFFDGMRARGVHSERLFTVARNLPPVSMYGMRSLLAQVPAWSGAPLAKGSQQAIEPIAAKSA